MSSNTWENWQTFGSKSEDNCLAECEVGPLSDQKINIIYFMIFLCLKILF